MHIKLEETEQSETETRLELGSSKHLPASVYIRSNEG